MLHSLDTLIGFAVVMAVVSVLITIVTQIVSAFLGLRGKNLSDALRAMIYKIDPEIDQQVSGTAKRLVERVLCHPIISDSILSMQPNFFDRVPGLDRLRKRWRIASVVRPRELLAVLQDLAIATPEAAAALDLKKHPWFNAGLSEAMATHADRVQVLSTWIDPTYQAQEAASNARKAAEEAASELDVATDKETAAKQAAIKASAAAGAEQVASHATALLNHIEATLQDDVRAKEFVEMAPLRAAAVKILARLHTAGPSPVAEGRAEGAERNTVTTRTDEESAAT